MAQNRLEELRERSAKAKQAKAPPRKPTMWQVGDLVKHEGKVWRVGLHSELRMRLDPISAKQVKIFDHTMNDYGGSINVSPTSILERVDPHQLTDQDRRREAVLIGRGESASVVTGGNGEDGGTVDRPTPPSKYVNSDRRASMNDSGQTAVVAQPPSGAQKANKERLEKLRAKNKAGKITPAKAHLPQSGGAKAQLPAKSARTNGSGEKSKAATPCVCGCGEMVNSYFYQGHDARFKGWLLKVERGVMAVKELPKSVQSKFEWKKKGEGFIPSTNYKGEKHTGYDKTNR